MRVAGLTFQWTTGGWFSWRLFSCLGVSAGVHALAFLLVQVVERDHASSPAWEKEVTFLSWDVPSHQALLSVVEAESPTGTLEHPLLSAESELTVPLPRLAPQRLLKLAEPRDPDAWHGTPVWLGGGSVKEGGR